MFSDSQVTRNQEISTRVINQRFIEYQKENEKKKSIDLLLIYSLTTLLDVVLKKKIFSDYIY